jgi:hypothetical protein
MALRSNTALLSLFSSHHLVSEEIPFLARSSSRTVSSSFGSDDLEKYYSNSVSSIFALAFSISYPSRCFLSYDSSTRSMSSSYDRYGLEK